MTWLPTVNGPKDLPDLRRWLLEHWRPGTQIHRVFGHESLWLERTLKTAALWWVEGDTCRVLADSAPTIPADHTLTIGDLPAASGLAVFAHDLEGIDADPAWAVFDGKVRVSAVMWGPITIRVGGRGPILEALAIASFSRSMIRDGNRLPRQELIRAYPMIASMLDTSVEYTKEAYEQLLFGPDGQGLAFPACGDVYSYLGRSDWLPGVGPDTPLPGDDGVTAAALQSKAEDRRLVAALWTLTRSSLAEVTTAPIDRAARRRAARKGFDPTVRVLRLGGERTVGRPSGVSERDWKHSWIVSPHFRWQAHGPGRVERKLILVQAYRKGDPSLPLLGTERVWRVVPPKN